MGDESEPLIQQLESQGFPCVYSQTADFDHLVEMKKLNHSVLVNFLELLDLLITNPASEQRQLKMEQIKVIFVNLHHLINEFRPHQARETLRVLLRKQREQRLETAKKLSSSIEKTRLMLDNCNLMLKTARQEADVGTDVKEEK